jgi:catechol 2,3-dioxygenase-like lactoylglutathione lyase family enzyme
MTLAVSLACSSFTRSLRFYTDILGFTTMRFEPDRRRAEVERDAVSIDIMEAPDSALAPLEYPFGRGVTLIVWSNDVEAVYAGVQAYGARLHVPLHEVWREEEGQRTGHAAFEVIDPDGYVLKFCQAFPPGRG